MFSRSQLKFVTLLQSLTLLLFDFHISFLQQRLISDSLHPKADETGGHLPETDCLVEFVEPSCYCMAIRHRVTKHWWIAVTFQLLLLHDTQILCFP